MGITTMKTYKINLFNFEELSDDAKRVVCDKERENPYNFGTMAQETDAEERVDTLNEFCKLFGITYRIDWDHQYRFIHWQFEDVDMNGYDWCDEDIKGKYLLRYLNRYYYQIRNRKWYHVDCDREKNNGKGYKERYSKILWIEQNCPFTGMIYDCDILDKIFDWYHNPNWEITLHDLFDECFSHFMKQWELEDDYRMSDEHIGDMISANWGDKLYFENGEEFLGDVDELDEYAEKSDAE